MADPASSTTIADDTSTTLEDTTSTTLGDTTSTTVVGNEPGDDKGHCDRVGHDQGEATETADESEAAQVHEHEHQATTTGSSDHRGRVGGGHDGHN